MKRTLLIVGLFALCVSGCSEVSQRGAINFRIKQLFISQAGNCNNKIFITKGKVDSSTSSDGWSMIDARTNKLIRVSGDAIILDAEPEQVSVYMSAKTLREAQLNLLAHVQGDGTILPELKACQR
jgi:hypothetical protein